MDQASETSVAYMMFVGIVGMLLLAVAVILFFVLYQRRLLAQQENMREMEIAHQRKSMEYIIQAQETERKRIAQELHDGIGAQLSATKLYVKRLPEDEAQHKDIGFIKKEAGGLIDETIDNIRTITRNLIPTSLERFGLMAAVEDLCKRINNLGSIKVNFNFNKEIRFDAKKEMNIYRIIQELINNTLKYAEASTIDIDLNSNADHLKLTYTDNGKGFELPEKEIQGNTPKGLGIHGIKSRAEVLNADLEIKTAPNNGFFVSLELQTSNDHD